MLTLGDLTLPHPRVENTRARPTQPLHNFRTANYMLAKIFAMFCIPHDCPTPHTATFYTVNVNILFINRRCCRIDLNKTLYDIYINCIFANQNYFIFQQPKYIVLASLLRVNLQGLFTDSQNMITTDDVWRCCPLQGPAATEPWPV